MREGSIAGVVSHQSRDSKHGSGIRASAVSPVQADMPKYRQIQPTECCALNETNPASLNLTCMIAKYYWHRDLPLSAGRYCDHPDWMTMSRASCLTTAVHTCPPSWTKMKWQVPGKCTYRWSTCAGETKMATWFTLGMLMADLETAGGACSRPKMRYSINNMTSVSSFCDLRLSFAKHELVHCSSPHIAASF
jgi:hypothetical protein